jgi:SAM-dependent methyltransferase
MLAYGVHVPEGNVLEAKAQQLYEDARDAAGKGRLEDAIAKYREVLSRLPTPIDSDLLARLVYEMALLFRSAHHDRQAQSLLEKAVELDPLHRPAAELARGLAEALGDRPPEAEVAAYLEGFFGHDPHARSYISVHLRRFIETLALIPAGDGSGRLLEVGANTFFSTLLRRHARYELHHSDWWPGPERQKDITIAASDPSQSYLLHLSNFNVERDPFPYPDDHFQVVVACEILEHLPNDPMFMMAEINRILVPGGKLVLTTPNIVSLRSLMALLEGFPPYVYNEFSTNDGGRHCKEWAPREIRLLFARAGFEVDTLKTLNVWADADESNDWWALYEKGRKILRSIGSSTAERGEDILVVGSKSGPVVDRYPRELYALP